MRVAGKAKKNSWSGSMPDGTEKGAVGFEFINACVKPNPATNPVSAPTA